MPSNYLSPNQQVKISKWLAGVHSSPFVLEPLHGFVQNALHENVPNMGKRPTPTYNYQHAADKKNTANGSWKSHYLAMSSREHLKPDDSLVREYCQRLGLDNAFRPELNSVTSMSSLPNAGENELITDSRTVLKREFCRVLEIRNSFYAEQQLYTALLSSLPRLLPEVTIFYETRQTECCYGCEKAQGAAKYIQAYAATEGISIDFEELLSALPYPEVMDEEGTTSLFTQSSDSSRGSTRDGSTTMVSSIRNESKSTHLRKEAITETDYHDWKDR
ncbi:hypothetical protein AGABI1DRAFT_131343 [Agaricus bisporus var. burnettii JB137-S8]|uniref:Uncharacterized protein n=1 Tax=Agaricus bisporus var. burnettii (strain JB137-S8 / ATCC MYA-4627 / FGSC 10392) TaxID=597362 RepID=K5X0V4_AGABU|nr:uncharacterized protein AGABI1DRAFT_131343 [Agaricus bisporus var. burnettii JB137-S8]EKM76522.1 hypothetical protein AGABI1DRAFT_131343 [Agaricus bisporus var. burnettii JB137-S8]